MAQVKTGLVSVTFRQKSVEEIAALTAEAGLSGVEWGGDVHVPPGDREAARRAARLTRQAGLEVLSYGSYYRCQPGEDFTPVLESALALSDDQILKVKDLPIRISAGRRHPALHEIQQSPISETPLSLEEQEILAIVAALERNKGHREKTARELGISRRTLQYKLRRFHLI